MNLKRIWPGVVLVALALAVVLAPAPRGPAPAERFFHITASQFAYSPGVLHVNPGDRVTITLEAQDVVHGLAIDGYEVALEADPGQTRQVSFVAAKPGMYRFRCTVTCGNMHPFMIGKIQVGPNFFYWRAAGLGLLALIAGLWRLRS